MRQIAAVSTAPEDTLHEVHDGSCVSLNCTCHFDNIFSTKLQVGEQEVDGILRVEAANVVPALCGPSVVATPASRCRSPRPYTFNGVCSFLNCRMKNRDDQEPLLAHEREGRTSGG